MITSRTQSDILDAATSELAQDGYDIIKAPRPSLLPEALQRHLPDAVAIGRDPKLVIEVAGERPSAAKRVAEMQQALKEAPGWQLYLVLDRASGAPEPGAATDDEIAPVLDRAASIAQVDERAALPMLWGVLEAIGRRRMPSEFARRQSAERTLERLAIEGIVMPSDVEFLRSMAQRRNAFVHGDFRAKVSPAHVARFIELLRGLMVAPAPPSEAEPIASET